MGLSRLKRLWIVGIFSVGLSTSSYAQSRTCVKFNPEDTPARLERLPAEALWGDDSTWCYETYLRGSRHFQLVYKLPTEKSAQASPDLSMLVELSDQDQVISVTHQTGARGSFSTKIRRRRISNFSPLGIPLTLSAALKEKYSKVEISNSDLSELEPWANAQIGKLSDETLPVIVTLVKEGTFESNLSEEKLPFRGYWWSGDSLAHEKNSPLEKYDAFVRAHHQTDPGASDWEKKNHAASGTFWSGHCNGWAASSLLYPEPANYLWDSKTHTLFLPSDLKGILAEASFCVNLAFFGHRYWGNPGDVLTDIDPDLFHKVLIYYIDQLKLPVAFDHDRDTIVDNHIISGYQFQIKKSKTSPHQMHVVATLREHDYDHNRSESVGKEPYVSKRSYAYTLTLDDQGEIIGGEWDKNSDNPDFLWVPLSPSEDCTNRNAGIRLRWVNEILSLPKAETIHRALDLKINQAIAGQDSISFPLGISGTNFKLHWSNNSFTQDQLVLHAFGKSIYTDQTNESASQLKQASAVTSFDANLKNPLFGLDHIVINNPEDGITKGSTLNLDWIEYLGGE